MIARGRDAADVAISTAFGPSSLQLFRVWTDAVSEQQASQMLGCLVPGQLRQVFQAA